MDTSRYEKIRGELSCKPSVSSSRRLGMAQGRLSTAPRAAPKAAPGQPLPLSQGRYPAAEGDLLDVTGQRARADVTGAASRARSVTSASGRFRPPRQPPPR